MAKKNLWVATTKTDFIKLLKNQLAEKEVALTNDQAKSVYDTFLKIIRDTVASEEKMNLNGFGTFKMRKLSAREGVNPQTGKKMKIKASKTVGFKPASSFKESL